MAVENQLTKKIIRAIRLDIAAGRWPVGEFLPPRTVMGEEYGVNSTIIGQALRALTEEGLVDPPIGTAKAIRVSRPQRRSGNPRDFFADPAWTVPKILTVDTLITIPPPAVADALQREPSARLLRWRSLRVDGAQVVAVAEGWYPPAPWLTQYTITPQATVPFYAHLAGAAETPPLVSDDTLTARVATEDERTDLRETGQAALVVIDLVRVTRTDTGVPLEWLHLCLRASRYEYTGTV